MLNHIELFDAIPVGVLIWRPSGLVHANIAACSMLGFVKNDPGFEDAVQGVTDLLREIHSTPERREALSRAGERRYPRRLHVRHRAGYPVPVSVIPAPFPGLPDTLLAVVIDLTAQADEERLEKFGIVGRWAAAAAHELRTPVAAVKTTLEAVRRNPEQSASLVAEAIRELERAGRAIHNLLVVTRPTPAECRAVSAWELLLRAVEDAMDRAGAQGVRFYHPVQAGAAEPPPVMGHPVLMQQAFKYLLDNALDALPDGGIVLLDWSVVDGRLRLDVSDSGPGIGQDLRLQVFEAFFTTKPGGLGLGLTLCQDILQVHGGAVELGEGPVGGARASIYLPLASPDAPVGHLP